MRDGKRTSLVLYAWQEKAAARAAVPSTAWIVAPEDPRGQNRTSEPGISRPSHGGSDEFPVADPVCFTCGEPVGEPYRLNRLEDGTICPSCRDRVLAALPPIFPSRPRAGKEIEVDAGRVESDDPPPAS